MIAIIDYEMGNLRSVQKAIERVGGDGRLIRTPAELARWSWWHAAGHESGRWVVADNWHGDIVLFDGRTARMRRLTLGHRTYGVGAHPHVGWDRRGERVVFTSHMLGNPDVCVATIPETWQRGTGGGGPAAPAQ